LMNASIIDLRPVRVPWKRRYSCARTPERGTATKKRKKAEKKAELFYFS